MPSHPLVSIIIPAYQMGQYLEHTLKSVIAQNYTYWECVIIDDGSTDNTQKKVQHIIDADSRFRYVRQINAGISAARNTGLKLISANTKYVAFLDADDIWKPEILEKFISALEVSPGAVGIYGYADYIDEKGELFEEGLHPSKQQDRRRIKGLRLTSVEKEKFIDFSEMIVVSPIYPASIALHRKKIVDRIEPFDTSLAQLEDWDYYLRMSRHGNYITHPKVVAYYRKHDGQITKDKVQNDFFNFIVRRKALRDQENSHQQYLDAKNSFRQIKVRALAKKVIFKVKKKS